MARSHHRRWIGLGALIAVAIGVAWMSRESARAPHSRPRERAAELDAHDAAAPAPRDEPSRSSPPAPPPVSGAAPPACPDDEPDDADFVRPSLWDALRVRTDELRDRLPQLSRDASPALRDGLNGLGGPDPDRAIAELLGAPDRVRDGFDVATAAVLHAGMRAIAEEDLRAAARRAHTAVTEAEDDPLAHALAYLVADRAYDTGAARAAIARAYALAPDEPAIALAAARADTEAADFAGALSAIDAYLRAVPEDARIQRWRERIAIRADLVARHARRSMGGIEVAYSSRALSSSRIDHVAEVIGRTLDDVARLTGHARRAELAVVVYADRDELRRATCTPSWTGAVFDGVLQLDAETLARDDASWERVVRHESAHAQLARVEGPIPHWLNEGFAQWMEGPPSDAARHAWQRMVRDRFWIPFESLEGGLLVIDDPRDAGLAYHQSLAMMLYLVDRRGPRAIRDAVQQIEAGRHEGLLAALVPDASGESLLTFLASREAP